MKWIIKLIKKIKLEIKCANADYMYKYMMIYEGSFLPSFYLRHTPEEATRIKKEFYEEAKKLLDSLDEEDDEDKYKIRG